MNILQIGHSYIRAYKKPPVRAEPMKNITVMLFIGSAQNDGLLHGNKLVFDGFLGILTGYLSVAQGHFFGIFYSSWDAPSTGIPIDAWC